MMTARAGSAPAAIAEQPLELLEAVQEALSEHQMFGSSDYIRGQLRAVLERRLEKIAPRIAGAGELLDALARAKGLAVDHVVGDTVVRCSIVHAHSQLEANAEATLSLDTCEEILTATATRLRDGNVEAPLSDGSLRRIGDDPRHGWIWSEEHADDVFGHAYRRLLEARYQAVPVTPTDEEIAKLQQGVRLLTELLPELAPSALAHAHAIALVPSAGGWTGVASASQFRLGGSIFLGRFLESPWWVAEHVFHEALHQKLYDFRQAHHLLLMDSDGDRERMKVPSIWNSPKLNGSNLWDVHRVFAAFHVYAHLALFGAVAELRAAELEDRFGPLAAMTSSRKAVERAHYLGEQLTGPCWEQLGLAGQGLAEWLVSVLGVLDPSPPPPGAYLHLCLDLYEREAGEVAAVLARNGARLRRDLPALARDEIERARRVLVRVDAPALAPVDDTVAFPALRIQIGRALLAASPDGYGLNDPRADADLQDLIATQSQRLFALLSGYPLPVADAKIRAAALGFGSSCRDEVGRLLTVLAAGVRPGGRILEIGTGAGVGTGWIVEGLEPHGDVEVVSLEREAELSDATRAWPWSANVRIVTADAIEALARLGEFDLVFADAAPVKYGALASVVRALRSGGILVVDDLGAGDSSTERQLADKEALRRAIFTDSRLQAVELDVSSGLLVAAKRR